MKFESAAIILGAGASKGARVPGNKTPPLDADFLDAAANFFRNKRAVGPHRDSVKSWKEFTSSLKSAGLDFSVVKKWRLEQLSTFLEARSSLRGLQLGRGRPRNYAVALESLKRVVCYVLHADGGTNACTLHKKLFKACRPKTVISFNYDLIADQSLLELDYLNWREPEYSGARKASIPSKNGRNVYEKIISRPQRISIPLLKLHGSIHYEQLPKERGFQLSGTRLPNGANSKFEYLRVPKVPYIIPPVAAKIEIKQPALRERWYEAVRLLHDAPVWIIWGYSFPATDTISQVLFRTALARHRKSKPVIVVNPDASVPNRIDEICRKVRISYYPSMERLLMDAQIIRV